MNDPHVVALVYRIEHSDSFDYSKAAPLRLKNQTFRRSIEDEDVRFDLSVKDGMVRIELHSHYPTIGEAHKAVEEYLRVWEFDVQIKRELNSFRLVLDPGQADIIDRSPLPGHTVVNIVEKLALSDSLEAKITFGEYPAPPSGLALNPDIETMYRRYMGYKMGREPLPGMAYFCLSMVENLPNLDGSTNKKRKAAADRLNICPQVLDEVGRLSSTCGEAEARKHEGFKCPLSAAGRGFLDAAVQAIIRRAAEKEHPSPADHPKISLSDLPSLEDEGHSGKKTRKEI